MSKELLIAGGFAYSEMHDSYKSLSSSKYKRNKMPEYYVSSNGNQYSFADYSSIDTRKNGFLPLPQNEYPYKIIYKNV